ncbi:MAG: glycosyltransferase [Bacteroidales bacterium]|nr:glycosyltransferase [Bacteroidales bacterium]MCF8332915.1 glycosyltransferase [Bacteroidales bacterium]
MFGWEFPPHITGGLGTACFGLTNGLAANEVNIRFVVPKAYGDEDETNVRIVNASDVEVNYNDLIFKDYWNRVSYVEVGSNLVPYVSPEEYYDIVNKEEKRTEQEGEKTFTTRYDFSGSYGKDLHEEIMRYAIVASEIAKKEPHDLIHAHDWLTYPSGIAAAEASGKPLVIHIHATEFDRSGRDNINHLVYDIEKRGFEAADRIIAVSQLTKNILINDYGIREDKIDVVHNAVIPKAKEITEAEKAFPEKIVTFLGRVTFQKGPEYFVEAAYKILQRDKNVRFVMAGSGDMLRKIIRRAAALRIADRFHFTGFLKSPDVDTMFALSDVYVMPSVSEPFGISPLEAMRSNVPVVISKQSGVSEILKHALKVDFWDVDALSNAIYGLLHYDALSIMFRKYGKTEVDNLKWEKAAMHVKEVYKKVLNSKTNH